MKKNKFRSGIAVIAAALTLSQGTGLTASAESYRVIEDPFFPGVTSYVYEDGHYTDIQEQVRYYEPAAPKRVNSAADAKQAGSKAAELPIDAAHFPDAKFRAYISKELDKDGSGGLSNSEIGVNYINVNYIGIASLKGIEYFPFLNYLTCQDNVITSIDLSQNTELTTLCIDYNKLTSLDVSNNTALTSLSCDGNNLTSLDVSNNTALIQLNCDFNDFTQLNISNNTALTSLWCRYDNLTQLDISKNTALKYLECSGNNLTSLDISNNTALTGLNCDYNNLASLDVSNNTALDHLVCRNNNLTTLDVSNNAALETLNCGINNLTALDVSNNTALTLLQCERNKLKSLDISNTALRCLDCRWNYFKSKSDIVGLDEEAIADCNYIEQYYEGFRYKGSSADVDWDKVQFPTEEQVFSYMPELLHTKVITHGTTCLHWDFYHRTLPNYTFVSANCVGIPEKIVTDDGIVFVPSPSESTSMSGISVERTWICREDENRLRFVSHDIGVLNPLFIVYEPGEYTFIYNITYTLGSRSKTYTKEYTITAVDEADHVHEYTKKYYDGWNTDSGGYNFEKHSRHCYCGVTTDAQPHDWNPELAIVPYLNGTNLYYKLCTGCEKYVLVNAKNSKTLTDSDSGIDATELDENAIPDGAELYVTDVTATEKIDPNALKNIKEVFDIALKQGGVEQQPNGNIAVRIPVPEGVNGEKAKVYRKEANGTFTDMKAVYNPQSKTLAFVTNHLSIYAITGGDVLLGDVNGDGKINNTDIILLGRSYMAGTWAQYLDVADMNDDNNINNTDIILLGRLYMSMSAR